MAVEAGKPIAKGIDLTTEDIRRSNIYLFERRMSTKIIPQLVNCSQPAITSITTKEPLSAASFKQLQWQPLTADDDIIKAVCQ